jgi:DNA-binding response OmpR family regulator
MCGQKTILVFSRDLNFCFSLADLFRDRYHVVTTTNIASLCMIADCFRPALAIVDELPSDCLLKTLQTINDGPSRIPVILLYVYSERDLALDRAFRASVEEVFYKPVEMALVSKRIDELLLSP